MNLHLQPVQVATKSDDTESQLVFADGFLVAVLVRLSEQHEGDAGKWFLEAGFGPVDPLSAHRSSSIWTKRRLGSWISCQPSGDGGTTPIEAYSENVLHRG